MKIIWSISGSDPLACSGLQADIKTAAALGVHCCTIQTSLTAQNNEECSDIQSLNENQIADQFQALLSESTPHAIKIGMIASREAILTVSKIIRDLNVPVVYDPVFATSSGGVALSQEDIIFIKSQLLPHITLLTPNIPEAELLLGFVIKDRESIRKAGQEFRDLGVSGALIKGGHTQDTEDATDFFIDQTRSMWITSQKLDGDYRGTGCYLSTAIACALAQGMNLRDATVFGRMNLMEAMESSFPLGQKRVLRRQNNPRKTPKISYTTSQPQTEPFPDIGSEPIGFYPVLPSLDWLQRLLPLGIRTAQLRIKNRPHGQVEDEIIEAIKLAREWKCRLFINDFWELAIKHSAYGVHLGQEDLDSADTKQIFEAKLRLGISTHSLEELSRANTIKPSYIALGPIFETTCKSMSFGPQGIDRLREWQSMSNCPVVAIGGLKPEHVSPIKATGVSGIALISDVTEASRPEARAQQWLELMGN